MTEGHLTDADDQCVYVEYCLANVSPQQREVLEYADVATRGVACLDRCGRCYRSTFLVVNGDPIEGNACDQFVDALQQGELK